MLNKLAFQLLFLTSVAIITALVLSNFSINLFLGFIIGILVQYGLFYGFSTILDVIASLKNKKLEIERLKELSYQGLEVTCPCFKGIKDFVPIKLNTSNYYKCSACKKTISVYITPETAIVTEPADSSLQHVETVLTKGLSDANTR